MRYRRPDGILALLAAWALLLCGLQYFTISKFSLLDSAGYPSLGRFLEAVAEKALLDGLDWALLAGVGAIFVALVALEARRGQVSVLLGWVCASERRAVGAVIVAGAVAVRYYFAVGGMYWGGDASAHLAYAWIAAESVGAGEWPIWTNYLGCGTPYLQFYGFLFFYLVGFFELVCRDFYFAVKVVLAACHVLSGWGMYGFARRATRSRQAGLVAGLAFVLSFWHAQQVLVMGRYPLALVYALLPLPFWAFEQGGRSAALWGGIALGALAFAHPGYAFWATGFWCLYTAVRLGLDGAWRARGGQVLMTLGVGVVFGAYQTLPLWLERGYTVLRSGIELTSVPDPSWQHLLFWSNHHLRLWQLPDGALHWYGGYVGVSLVLLALAAAVSAVRRRRGTAAVVSLAVALLLVFGYRLDALQVFAPVRSFNAARYLLFVVFFLSLAAGWGASALRAWGRRRLGAVVILSLLVDLGPTTLLDMYHTSREESDALLDRIAARMSATEAEHLPGVRMLTTLGGAHPYLQNAWSLYKTGVPLAQADPGNLLTASDRFANAFGTFLNGALGRLDEDIAEVRASAVIKAGVELLNVRHVLAVQQDGGQRWLSWAGQSPVLVAGRARGYATADLPRAPADEEVQRMLRLATGLSRMQVFEQLYPIAWLIAEMGVDVRRNSCAEILIDGGDNAEDLGTDPTVTVTRHQVWNQRVEIDLEVSQRAFARLAYAHYPHLAIYVDGREVEPLRTTGGFVALRLQAGAYSIVLEPRLSPLRRMLLALDSALLAAAAALWWRSRRG